ncbi:MAG: hypothetical protein IEMM0008_0033 [bacterium]|nr:MAG: hypothetical protein IEMM0008_0033 [bacterium]
MFGDIFNKKSKYKFSDPKNTASIMCSHVLENQMPILYVTHDEDDGGWQFLCGAENHEDQHGRIIALFEVTTIDPSVNKLYDMPPGVGAERESRNDQWQPFYL